MDIQRNPYQSIKLGFEAYDRYSGLKYMMCKCALIVINLLLISSSFYINYSSKQTNNWEYSRQVGLIAKEGYCSEYYTYYDVDIIIEEWNILTNDINSTIPTVFLRHGDKQQITLNCLSSAYHTIPTNKLVAIDTGNSIETFTSYFNPVQRDYFPFVYYFALYCIIDLSSLLYVIYIHRITAPPTKDKCKGDWIVVLVFMKFFLACLLVYMSPSFVHEESCIDTYNKPDAEEYCNKLSSLGLTILSKLSPTELLVQMRSLYTIGLSILGMCIARELFETDPVFRRRQEILRLATALNNV
jgi:hypothetical protein